MAGAVVGVGATAGAAHADSCYTWNRTLSQGSSGGDVTQLQIRVAGWVTSGERLSYDGPVRRTDRRRRQKFQAAYGLSADGVAGPATFSEIYASRTPDCTPVHFSYAELNKCNSDWSGGAVSAATAKSNALKTMWQTGGDAARLGDVPINISSGFRSRACNNAVGGSPPAVICTATPPTSSARRALCRLAQQSRAHGFSEILGPGYPGHNDHTHVAFDPSPYCSAPTSRHLSQRDRRNRRPRGEEAGGGCSWPFARNTHIRTTYFSSLRDKAWTALARSPYCSPLGRWSAPWPTRTPPPYPGRRRAPQRWISLTRSSSSCRGTVERSRDPRLYPAGSADAWPERSSLPTDRRPVVVPVSAGTPAARISPQEQGVTLRPLRRASPCVERDPSWKAG
ncbi:D-Ala-D-Ala carboxypeptidase family metallohydrolase [Streptomyces thinghirensis]|nr:D-Ala-D-Ala carboxypeptidase family metallohydrolase [Streptomyces thinghirensis]